METTGRVAPFADDIEADELQEPQTRQEIKQERLQRGVIIDNGEDRSIGYCKLIVNYPKLTFGKIKYSLIALCRSMPFAKIQLYSMLFVIKSHKFHSAVSIRL